MLRHPMKRNVTQHHHKERYLDQHLEDGMAFTQTQLFVLFQDFVREHHGTSAYHGLMTLLRLPLVRRRWSW